MEKSTIKIEGYIWQQPEVIHWSQILTNSYQRLLGKKLINSVETPEELETVCK